MSATRDRSTALLSRGIEFWLRGATVHHGGETSPQVMAADAWDVWWVCTRAGRSASELGIDLRHDDVRTTGSAAVTRPGEVIVRAGCGRCVADVGDLTRQAPEDTTDPDTWARCSCAAAWARRMRESDPTPDPTVTMPAWRLSVGVVKPGADVAAVQELLTGHFEIVATEQRMLSVHDVHRLYPEAYGLEFRRRQNAYLTSQPVHVLALVAPARLTTRQHQAAKMAVRTTLGGTDDLRNHLHMADNAGESWCDAQHLIGPPAAQLYERYGA